MGLPNLGLSKPGPGGNGANGIGGEYKGGVMGIGGNGGSASGGGLYLQGTSLTLLDSTIVQNQATGGLGGNGVLGTYDTWDPNFLPPPDPYLTFVGNGGSGSGGGLDADGASAQLVNDTLYGNTASGSPGGSGTYFYWARDDQGQHYYIDVTVVGNTGSGTGGGLTSRSGAVTLANTIIALDTGGTVGSASTSDVDGTVSSSAPST